MNSRLFVRLKSGTIAICLFLAATLALAQQQVQVTFYNGYQSTITLGVVALDGQSVEVVGDLQPGFENAYNVLVGSQWYAYDQNEQVLESYKVTNQAIQVKDFGPQQPAPQAVQPAVITQPQSFAVPPAEAQFGSTIWMTENANLETNGSTCFDENANNCGKSGRLYTWAAAQTVCGALGQGWRLPSDQDWAALVNTYGGAYGGSGDGKGAYGALINSNFDPKLGGKRLFFKDQGTHYFYDYDTIGYYWANQNDSNDAGRGRIYTFRSSDSLLLRESAQKENYNSVRCVKSAAPAQQAPVSTAPVQQARPQVTSQPIQQPTQQQPVAAPTPVAKPEPVKPKLPHDPNYQRWLQVDATTDIKEEQSTTWLDLSHEPFQGGVTMEQGFNIFLIDGDSPSDRKLTEKVKIFDNNLDPNTKQFTNWANKFSMPFSLDFQHMGTGADGEREEISFSNEERRQSKSLSVSLGVSAPKGSAEVGYSRTDSKSEMNERGRISIHRERWGAWGQLSYDKRYMKLSKEFKRRVNGLSEHDQAGFERFFRGVGTHYAIRGILGGKAALESISKSSKHEKSIETEVSKSASVSVPVKAVNVNASVSTTDSDFRKKSTQNSDTTINTYLYGGSLGAGMEEWMVETDDPSEMKLLRVDLRPISDLIRPQLFGITDVQEAAKFDRLRMQMSNAYNAFKSKAMAEQVEAANWRPRIYKIRINHVKATKVNDTEIFFGSDPEISGVVTMTLGSKSITALDISDDDDIEMKKGDTLPLAVDELNYVMFPQPQKDQSGVAKPVFVGPFLTVNMLLKDDDHGEGTKLLPPLFVFEDLSQKPRNYFAGKGRTIKKYVQSDHAGTFELSYTITEGKLKVENITNPYPEWLPL